MSPSSLVLTSPIGPCAPFFGALPSATLSASLDTFLILPLALSSVTLGVGDTLTRLDSLVDLCDSDVVSSRKSSISGDEKPASVLVRFFESRMIPSSSGA